MSIRRLRRDGAILAGLLIVSAAAWCGPHASGAEADARLAEQARREGRVVWYTTLIVQQLARPMAEAFQRAYGIRVEFFRANSEDLVVRLINEARARRVTADVVHLSTGIGVLKQSGTLRPLPAGQNWQVPPEYRDKNGHWVATNVYVLTPAYNTNLLGASGVPKIYTDLLGSDLKGKMAWSAVGSISGTGASFVANVLSNMGQEQGVRFLCRLARQEIVNLDMAARAVLDRVIAGEYPLALQIFNYHASISAQQGAPVRWIPMEPATVTLQLAALTAGGPHPSAGQLFLEFMMSDQGQQVFREAGYIPARPDIPPKWPEVTPQGGGFRATVFLPEEIDANFETWNRTFESIFVRKSYDGCA